MSSLSLFFIFLSCARLNSPPISSARNHPTPASDIEESIEITDPVLNAQALEILSNRCDSCHGASGAGGISNITDLPSLIANRLIVPGNSGASPVYTSVRQGSMPPADQLPQNEIDTHLQWIDTGMKRPEGIGSALPSPTPLPPAPSVTGSANPTSGTAPLTMAFAANGSVTGVQSAATETAASNITGTQAGVEVTTQ